MTGTGDTRAVAMAAAFDCRAPLRRLACAVAVAIGLLAAALPNAEAAVLRASADAYATAAHPDRGFGKSRKLRVEHSPRAKTYLRFQLDGVSGRLERASLKVFVRRGGRANIDLHRVPHPAWGETTLTFAQAPPLGRRVDSAGAKRRRGWITLDATPLIRRGGSVSAGLTAGGGSGRWISSRRHRSRAPRLVVEQREASVRHGASAQQLRGVQLHPLWTTTSVAEFDRELDLVQAAGADVVRMDVGWGSLELEAPGRFEDWYVERADTFIEHARARGLEVIMTLWGTPCWASSAPERLKQGCQGAWWERGVDRYPPADPGRFAEIAAWAARRWGDRLAALEIWNEPNIPYFMEGTENRAGAYAEMLKPAYRSIKAVAPDLTVLAGVMAGSDGEFLEQLYERHDIHGHYDGIAYHPYTEGQDPDASPGKLGPRNSLIDGTKWLRELMVANGDADLDLWATEFGSSSCTPGTHFRCVGTALQAKYTADYYRILAGFPYVRAAVTYNLRDTTSDPVIGRFGLVERDFTPKPAYYAFKAALRR